MQRGTEGEKNVIEPFNPHHLSICVCAISFTLKRRSELGVGKEADLKVPKVHLRLVETPGVKNCLKRPVSETWIRKSNSALSL